MSYVKCMCGEVFNGENADKDFEKHVDEEMNRAAEQHISIEGSTKSLTAEEFEAKKDD